MQKNPSKDLSPAARQEAAAAFQAAYERDFAPHLPAEREAGMRIILQRLQVLALERSEPLRIVETGSLRRENDWTDGQSTALWALFARHLPCEVLTIDTDPQAAALVQRLCGEAVETHTGDSVQYLRSLACEPVPRRIDLLYLDAFDFDEQEPFISAMFPVKELISARPCLDKGSIVAINHNWYTPEDDCMGKGYLAMQWFRHLGIPFVHKGYQMVWQL